jgi:CRISPR/Cas system-associated endoribonuclease Cas2
MQPYSPSKEQTSCLRYILKGLVPYTEANLKLTFKPGLFFRDLEKISGRKKRSFQNAYYQAIRQGMITFDTDGIPRLTDAGRRAIKPYQPAILPKPARLLVIFDIPEVDRWKRRQLRALLKELRFTRIQQSVWETTYDHREYLKEEIKRLGLKDSLIVYEAAPIIGS